MLAETEDRTKELIARVKARIGEARLLLNLNKTKIMTNTHIREIQVNGELIKVL